MFGSFLAGTKNRSYVFYVPLNIVYFIIRNCNDEALKGYNKARHLEIHESSQCLGYNIQSSNAAEFWPFEDWLHSHNLTYLRCSKC